MQHKRKKMIRKVEEVEQKLRRVYDIDDLPELRKLVQHHQYSQRIKWFAKDLLDERCAHAKFAADRTVINTFAQVGIKPDLVSLTKFILHHHYKKDDEEAKKTFVDLVSYVRCDEQRVEAIRLMLPYAGKNSRFCSSWSLHILLNAVKNVNGEFAGTHLISLAVTTNPNFLFIKQVLEKGAKLDLPKIHPLIAYLETTKPFLPSPQKIVKILTLLIDHGADPNRLLFYPRLVKKIFEWFSPEILRCLLERGLHPNGLYPAFNFSADELTILLLEFGGEENLPMEVSREILEQGIKRRILRQEKYFAAMEELSNHHSLFAIQPLVQIITEYVYPRFFHKFPRHSPLSQSLLQPSVPHSLLLQPPVTHSPVPQPLILQSSVSHSPVPQASISHPSVTYSPPPQPLVSHPPTPQPSIPLADNDKSCCRLIYSLFCLLMRKIY